MMRMLRTTEVMAILILALFVRVGHADDAEDAHKAFQQGTELAAKGDQDGAIAAFTRTIELAPKTLLTPTAHVHRGDAYLAKGDADKAIADYDKALELIPDNGMALFHRAKVHAGRKDYDRAIADYSKAIEIDPTAAVAYVERGNALQGKGDTEGACADWKKACDLGSCDAYEKAKADGLCQ